MNFPQLTLRLGLVGSALISALCLATVAQAASFGPTEINGSQYNITTVQGSYDGSIAPSDQLEPLDSRLHRQPWWGSSALAEEVASRVKAQLGLGNIPKNFKTTGANNEGPYFAFEVNGNNRVSAWNWDAHETGISAVELDTHNNYLNADLIWAVATPVPSTPATSVPTPALLPALLGFGAKLVHRQRQAEA